MSQARPLLPWSHVAVAMAIEFPDLSCPQMRCLRHRNRSDSLCMLTAVHLPTNLSAVGFRIRTFPFLFSPPLHIQEILMRVHMFGSRPREVLTLYLKLGLNSTRDDAVRVWHFPSKGHIRTPFTGLRCGAEAKNNRRMLRWSCLTIKPLLSPGLSLLPNWLQDLLTCFIGCFDSVADKVLAATLRGFSFYDWVQQKAWHIPSSGQANQGENCVSRC